MSFGLLQSGSLSDWLKQISESSAWLMPEIVLAITLILIIIFDLLFAKGKSLGLITISVVGLLFTLLILWRQWSTVEQLVFFNQMLRLSNLAILLKIVFTLAAGLTLFFYYHQNEEDGHSIFQSSEHLVMLFSMLIGAFLMTMTMNLLLVYLGIELVSISSYIIIALKASRDRSESALKYLVFGAVASAFMLYGMSWLYGFTGTLQIDSDSFYAGLTVADPFALTIALLLTLAGLLFKLGAFPMHLWSPDVYQSAPTPIVAFFSVVPKLAALTIIFRLVAHVGGLWDWTMALGIIAIGSMLVGNLSALWQKDAKRMLAFSSIAHSGFLLLGIITQSQTGNEAFLFYALIYSIMNFAAFGIVQYFERLTGSAKMTDWKGLGKTYPWMAILLLAVMVALTGLPPTAGFNAKLYLFSALWENYLENGKSLLLWLFIIGLFNTVIALFYYLKIPFYLFFKEPQKVIAKNNGYALPVMGTLLVIPLLLLFFRSDWFVDLMNTINFAF